MTASEAEVDEALSAALQRSHSTPEPLFGHAHLDFTNGSGLNQHGLLPNGNTNEYGKKFIFDQQGNSIYNEFTKI
jgi:hypothetical protein